MAGFAVGMNMLPGSGIPPGALSKQGTLQAPATANTQPSSWTTLIASTGGNAHAMLITMDGYLVTAGRVVAASFALGSAGNETPIINNLVLSPASAIDSIAIVLPSRIPAGSRISGKLQASGASDSINCGITTFSAGFGSWTASGICDTYGFISGSTIGTNVDPGSTINAKGAYSQIAAATTANIAGFFFTLDGQAAGVAATTTNTAGTIDIAIGTTGNEQIILPDYTFMDSIVNNVRRDMRPLISPFFPMQIPAGTRISARAQMNFTTAVARTFGLTLYGVRA